MAGFEGLYLSAGSQYVGIWRVCVICVTYFFMEWRKSVIRSCLGFLWVPRLARRPRCVEGHSVRVVKFEELV